METSLKQDHVPMFDNVLLKKHGKTHFVDHNLGHEGLGHINWGHEEQLLNVRGIDFPRQPIMPPRQPIMPQKMFFSLADYAPENMKN